MSDKPTIQELEEILAQDDGQARVDIAPDGSVHVGPTYKELQSLADELAAAHTHIATLVVRGPHPSAEDGMAAAMDALDRAREIARAALAKYDEAK